MGGHAVVVLEDGRIFRGTSFGAVGARVGEIVFSTGMTGYQETLTDPSYHGQIVVATAPQIGNTGWNDEDDESDRIRVAGYVVRDPARRPSNWRALRSLNDELVSQGVVGIAGVDTRAVTRHIRSQGAMRAGVFSDVEGAPDIDDLLARVLAAPSMVGADLAADVSTRKGYVVPAIGARRFRIASLDLGAKASTHRKLAELGGEVHVLPVTATFDDVLAVAPDGVFLSNGPGDPQAMDHVVALATQVLAQRIPLFGICFGNQILGRALGRNTYKMPFGHRGLNVPVVEIATGRVAITAQNHGFAVQGEPGEKFDTPFGPAVVSHACANDGTVEGLRCLDVPAFSVQYHPEAAAGPHDAAPVFEEFVSLLGKGRT